MCYKLEKTLNTILSEIHMQDKSLYKCGTERFKNIFFPSTIAKMSK